MESALVHALGLEYQPVALSLSDEAPRGARTPPKGRTCVMRFLADAARGETVALEKDTVSCRGGLIGLGFTGDISHMPGGEEGFYRFLSTGNRPHLKELGLAEAGMSEDFLDGERYLKTPELVKLFVEGLPAVEIEEKFVVLRPLSAVGPGEEPLSVTLLADPDQLSALVVLSNYGRETADNVIIPMGAGCHQIGIHVYREAKREKPRAVVGLTDLSARLCVNALLGDRYLTFSVPWRFFREMERDVPGSFLERTTWRKLMALRKKKR
ncbi:MAG: hypothetical protein A2Y64_05400 [Candidatus Coatesbacteria bacterium RBG_13_66_14]|uniref:DUF169 domain-containing protein n=1 Tax=Candidatus Coatesbacteria bacterium RBG_13_66_14 TaxID=1817816 RepID=A0A1F5F7I0_9BACT|nr:MAG: hypothetical protein A2Y64_05400 [Candidatus Coatesbacteria bacterium RBG_13_66_14]